MKSVVATLYHMNDLVLFVLFEYFNYDIYVFCGERERLKERERDLDDMCYLCSVCVNKLGKIQLTMLWIHLNTTKYILFSYNSHCILMMFCMQSFLIK